MEYDVEVTLKTRHTPEQLEELLDRLTVDRTIHGPVVMGWTGAVGVFGQVDVDADDPGATAAVLYAQHAVEEALGVETLMDDWITLTAQPHDWPLRPARQIA